MAHMLVIEDETNLRISIAHSLKRANHAVVEAGGFVEARKALLSQDFDAAIVDINLGEGDGVDLVHELRDEGRDTVAIVITGDASVESAVRAMKAGADEYLQKPVRLDELAVLLDRSLERREERRRLLVYERLADVQPKPIDIVGESPAWRKVVSFADRLALAPLPIGRSAAPPPTILIVGETGTGKNVLARRIHETATHAPAEAGDGPFVHVNCSALPAPLIESELFGHERGAFTDAREARAGLFEIATGGTIMLDEIAEMPIELQAKLLFVVETGSFRRVSGTRERRVQARIVAATNQDLEEAVDRGSFRRDLFYRLNAFTIRVPPLRERPEDILPIADALLVQLRQQHHRSRLTLSKAAQEALLSHDWPGNVRELANAMQRAAMLTDTDSIAPTQLGLTDAKLASRPVDAGTAVDEPTNSLMFDFNKGGHSIEEVERELIKQALRHTHGNITKAAKLVGMHRSSFRYRIERAGLDENLKKAADQ